MPSNFTEPSPATKTSRVDGSAKNLLIVVSLLAMNAGILRPTANFLFSSIVLVTKVVVAPEMFMLYITLVSSRDIKKKSLVALLVILIRGLFSSVPSVLNTP